MPGMTIGAKAEMNWFRSVRIDQVQSHIHNLAYPISIYLVHGEGSDIVFSESRLFPLVDVPKADIRQTRRYGVEPREWDMAVAVIAAERSGTRKRSQKG